MWPSKFHPQAVPVYPAPAPVHLNGKPTAQFIAILWLMLTQTPPDPVPAGGLLPAAGGGEPGARRVARPDFFIVGAPKCGTTAMSDYLALHPDIFMGRKEMHFFGSDLRFAGHFYRRAEPEYLAEFAGWRGQRRIGEASVWYLFSQTAAREIHAFNPEARIIIMLREPAEMMYSLFRYFCYDGNEPLRSFAAALAAEPERKAGRGLGRQTYFPPGLVYHETARFARQVRRYLEVFGQDRVHVVLQEDLAADTAAAYRSVLEFLEVDPAFRLPHFDRVNPAQTVKSRALRALLNDPTLRAAVLAVRPWLPNFVFSACQRIERILQGMNSSVERPQSLAPELKAQLRREFADDVAELSKLIGRDLSHWTAPVQP